MMIRPHPAIRILEYLRRDDEFQQGIREIYDDPDFKALMADDALVANDPDYATDVHLGYPEQRTLDCGPKPINWRYGSFAHEFASFARMAAAMLLVFLLGAWFLSTLRTDRQLNLLSASISQLKTEVSSFDDRFGGAPSQLSTIEARLSSLETAPQDQAVIVSQLNSLEVRLSSLEAARQNQVRVRPNSKNKADARPSSLSKNDDSRGQVQTASPVSATAATLPAVAPPRYSSTQ